MTIRLLHVVPTLYRGGAEEQMLLLAQHLPPIDYEQRVCALSGVGPLASKLQASPVSVVCCSPRSQTDAFHYWRLSQELQTFHPDVVHFWRPTQSTWARAVVKYAGFGRQIVETRQSSDRVGSRWNSLWDVRLASLATAICVPHDHVHQRLSTTGTFATTLHTLPPGVTLPAADASLSQIMPGRTEVLQQLGLPTNARYVVGVGKLDQRNRWKDAIWTADLLKVLYDDVHFVLIGEGPLRPQLERFRRKVCIVDRVHMPGYVHDIAPILQHATCLWSPSGRGGVRYSILQGMASGIPVIVGETPVNREIVPDQECGYVLPVGDRAA